MRVQVNPDTLTVKTSTAVMDFKVPIPLNYTIDTHVLQQQNFTRNGIGKSANFKLL